MQSSLQQTLPKTTYLSVNEYMSVNTSTSTMISTLSLDELNFFWSLFFFESDRPPPSPPGFPFLMQIYQKRFIQLATSHGAPAPPPSFLIVSHQRGKEEEGVEGVLGKEII